MTQHEGLSYAAAGVDIDAYTRMLERVKPLIAERNSLHVRQSSRWDSSRARSNVDSSPSSSNDAHSRARSQFPYTRLTVALTPVISRS